MRRLVLVVILPLLLVLVSAVSVAQSPLPSWYDDASCLDAITAIWDEADITPKQAFDDGLYLEEGQEFRNVGQYLKYLKDLCPNVPMISANPVHDHLWGQQWPVGHDVDISYYRYAVHGEDGASESLAAAPVMPYDGGDFGWIEVPLGEMGHDVMVGDIYVATNGIVTKMLLVTPLEVTELDVENDEIHGVADGRWTRVDLDVWMQDGGLHGSTEAGKGGAFGFDTTDDLYDDWGDPVEYDLGPGSQGAVREYDTDGDGTEVPWYVPNPRIFVNPEQQYVRGEEWPAGVIVEVTLPDGTPLYPEVESWGPNPWESGFHVEVEYAFTPGDVVLAQYDTIVKSIAVTGLTVETVDPDTDTVAGVADVGPVEVNLHSDDGAYRKVDVDEFGAWEAVFGEYGECDEYGCGEAGIEPGSQGDARELDDDGDGTEIQWWVSNPRLVVNPVHGYIYGEEWPVGDAVALSLNSTSLGDPVIVQPYEHDPSGDLGWFSYPSEGEEGIIIAVDDVVTAVGTTATKELVVTGLAVTDVDPDLETVTGIASPEAGVEVGLHVDPEGASRYVTADGSGDWTATFGPYGDCDEFGCGDAEIVPGSQGNAREYDDDGDATEVPWRVADPRITVNPVHDYVRGDDWPVGASVQLTLAYNGGGTVGATVSVEPYDHDPASGWFDWQLGEISADVEPGDTVTATVTDGPSKAHTVLALGFPTADPASDTVTGTATTTGATVDVDVYGDFDGAWRHLTATPGYTADFSIDPGCNESGCGSFDLVPGSEGAVREYEYEGDGDATEIPWRIPDPRILVSPQDDYVRGEEWPAGAYVDVSVGAILVAENVEIQSWGTAPWESGFHVDLGGEWDIQPGDTFTVTDGSITKTHVVTVLAVTELDGVEDVVVGSAAPSTRVEVYTDDGAFRAVDADGAGAWSVDFTEHVEGPDGWGSSDLGEGSSGDVMNLDEDRDATEGRWSVPSPG